jgi:hypothetical protein
MCLDGDDVRRRLMKPSRDAFAQGIVRDDGTRDVKSASPQSSRKGLELASPGIGDCAVHLHERGYFKRS